MLGAWGLLRASKGLRFRPSALLSPILIRKSYMKLLVVKS